MRLLSIALSAFVITLAIFGCGTNSGDETNAIGLLENVSNGSVENSDQKYFATDTIVGNASNDQVPITQVSKPDWDKKIIKTASLTVEIKEYKAYNNSLRDKARKYGGYIATENQQETDYKIENTATIKVPVDQFDNAVADLIAGTEKTITKNISSEDVTTQFVDTKSRLEAKKQVRYRYLDLLKQAKNMEEILNVQSEINVIQEDIEAAAGRIQYMQNASSYSTINLTYFQVLNPSAHSDEEPSFANKAWASFKNGWNWIGDVFVGLISVWPLFLLAFVAWVIYRRTRLNTKLKVQETVK